MNHFQFGNVISRRWRQYAFAIVFVSAAAALGVAIRQQLVGKTPLVFFVFAILASARAGGFGPGLWSTALSMAVGDWFFIDPAGSFRIAKAADAIDLVLLALMGFAISLLSGQLRNAVRRAEEEKERFRLISDSVPQILWSNRPDGQCDFMNARFYEYTGMEPGSAYGLGWRECIHPEDLAVLQAGRAEMMATGTRAPISLRYRRHDGVYRWFSSRVVTLRDADGKVLKFFGSSTDIDEIRQLREIAQSEKSRFEQIVTTAPGAMMQFCQRPDGSKAVPFATASIREIFGLDPESIENDAGPLIMRIHPDDRDAVAEARERSAATLSEMDVVYRVQHPDKGLIWVEGRSAPTLEADGTINWFGFLTDITERKAAEELRREKTQRELQLLKTLVEKAPAGLAMLDRKMRTIEVSQRWLNDIGMTREQVIGRCHYDIFPELPAEWRGLHARGMAGESLAANEETYRTPDGKQHWLNWRIEPWGDSGETTGGIIIAAEDLTAEMEVKRAARERELEYQALFENMSEGLAYCRMIEDEDGSLDFEYLKVNAQFHALTGLPEVEGRRASEAIPGITVSDRELLETYARVSRTGLAEKHEIYVKALQQWFAISVFSPGRGYFGVIFDVITKRKKSELEARRWQRVLEQTETPIALSDAETGNIETANEAFARALGYSAEELSGFHFAKIYPEDEVPKRAAALASAAEHRGHVNFETRYRRKDGTEFPVRVDSTAIHDDSGKIVSRVQIAQDLTTIKLAEAELRDREGTIHALLDSAAQAIIATSSDGTIVLVNRMAGTMFGYEPDDLVGQPLTVLVPVESRAFHVRHENAYFERPYTRHPGTRADLHGLRKDGTIFSADISLSHVDTRHGALAIAFVSDITDRLRAEAEIRELNAGLERRVKERTVELEAANRELESFSYSVSHDLRAPLRAIDAWSMALLEDYGASLDARAQTYLERVRTETARMGTLIEVLLQLSRVNRTPLVRTAIDLSATVAQIMEHLQKAQPERSIALTIEPGMTANGDPRLLEVVLTNLLDNAMKFTSNVREARIGFHSSQRDGTTEFCVEDNGAGFDMKYAGGLFGAFQRLHKASEFPGTGVGLATVQRIIRRHGGEIRGEAEPGHGARFSFTLGNEPQ